jgi:hypothetical protein
MIASRTERLTTAQVPLKLALLFAYMLGEIFMPRSIPATIAVAAAPPMEELLDIVNTVCEALDGDVKSLNSVAYIPPESRADWRRAAPFLEKYLNDGVSDHQAWAARLFNNARIALQMKDGRYIPDYAATADASIVLEIVPPAAKLRLGEALKLKVIEKAARPGQRICYAGGWELGLTSTDKMTFWQNNDDGGSNDPAAERSLS